MAKRRRRKITIKNSSLFAFFALVSLFLLDENSAYQHQNPYRYSPATNSKLLYNNQLQRHNYLLNVQQAPTPSTFGSSGGIGGSSDTTTSTSLDPMDLRSSQSSSFISQQNFQESSNSKQIHSQQKLNTVQQQQQQQHQFTTISSQSLPSVEHLCSKLPSHLAKQLKLCKLISHSPNVDNVVSLGATKGLAECRSQFRHDRWNCTHAAGDHQLLTSELTQSIGNPESGFIHAIAAAGIVHSIATACSVGNLSDCACDRGRVGTIASKRDEPSSHWKWGGCSNNIRHGMMFAKHFVELLDAVHQHTRLVQLQQQHHHNHHHQQQQHQYRQHHNHLLSKRATTIITSREHLSNYHRPPESIIPAGEPVATMQAAVAQRDFCQQNQNISQAKHHELIKSLLSRNSLEKHQEFRLAMNMHNNKIGRMAVAKNMIFHCRCHGLSGTCSLKTCWLTLPDLQVIGKYLKKKYERSVHLPKAVNLNKLIPMMDRQEISSILSSSSASSPYPVEPATESSKAEFIPQDHLQPQPQSSHHSPEFAALVHSSSSENGSGGDNNDGSQSSEQVEHTAEEQPSITPTSAPTQLSTTNLSTADERLSLYVNHRLQQQQQQQQWPTRIPKQPPVTTQATINEIPNNLEPLSQQQYQALLKEMKLCNTLHAAATTASHLQTRDLNQLNHYQQQTRNHHQLVSRHHHHHHNKQLSLVLNGQQTKQANLQLSHLLPHNDKDELIHLHRSPKYCDADLRHGFMGIQSRICSNVENAPDNCDRLCCGRGHREMILETRTSCNCQFQFCCTMTCGLCAQKTKVLVCN